MMARYIRTTFWFNLIAIASVKARVPAGNPSPMASIGSNIKYALASLLMGR
jgi:hypothetical protein